MRRVGAPKLAVVAGALVLALAGCGQAADAGDGPSGAAVTSAPADPAARLAAAATTLEKGRYRYSIDSPVGEMLGVVHAPSDAQQMSMTGKDDEGNEFAVEAVEIGTDRWMKVSIRSDDPVMKKLAKEMDSWRHVSREDAAPMFSAAEERMGVAASDLLGNVTGVKESGAGTFAGTLDLTASPLADLLGDSAELKAMGAKAQAVPVTITLDADGRASSIVFDVPAGAKSAAYRATIGFSDYDTVEAPKPPPADQVKES